MIWRIKTDTELKKQLTDFSIKGEIKVKLYLVKPDLTYYEEYNEMMKEWVESDTQIAPWFLEKPIPTIEEFAKFVKHLDDCEHGRLDEKYCSTTSYFVVDENNKLVGAASLRHYLTLEGMNTWGMLDME